MTIILFLIDTSGSMNQRTHYGARPTLLDVTKETVEKFIKVSSSARILLPRISVYRTYVFTWYFALCFPTLLCSILALFLNADRGRF